MAALRVRFRDGTERLYELAQRPLLIGRAASCDILLRQDAEVSRRQAEIWLDEEGCVWVTDIGSKNGTRVDDGPPFRNATRRVLRNLRIGDHELTIVGAPPPEPAGDQAVSFTPDPQTLVGAAEFFPSSRGLDLNRQRLELLMDLSQRMGRAFDRKQLLEQALQACCEALHFERGLIALKTPRGDAEMPVTRNVERDPSGAFKISRTLINRALLHGERAVVNNPATDLLGNLSESLIRFPIRSALCVPILYRDEILGVIYGDRVTAAAAYRPADADFLAAIAQQVGVGLENLRLLQEHVRSQKMFAEVQAARRIQRELLPAAPLVHGPLTVAGYNEPSSDVGGDYFDYFVLDDERVAFVIADVTGHGLPAALLMANLQAAVRVALAPDTPLPDLAARVNRLICQNTAPDVFITAILGAIHAPTGVIEYVSAGHPAPLLLGRGRAWAHREENSLPLGVEPRDEYRVQRVTPDLHAGVVLFYTDGLVECENPAGQSLGPDPIIRAFAALADPTADAVLRGTLDVVKQHLADAKNVDDLTLLAIQVRPAPQTAHPPA